MVGQRDIDSRGGASSRSWDAVRALWVRGQARVSKAMRALMKDRAALERLRHDREGELALVRAYQAGDVGAGLVLWKANSPLVQKRFPRALLWYADDELKDYWQEARLAFLEATARFDTSRGVRLSTFVLTYVRSYMYRAFANRAEVVRVPTYLRGTQRSGAALSRFRRVTVLFSEAIRPNYLGDADAIAFEETLVDEHPLVEEVLEGEELRARAHQELAAWMVEDLEERSVEILRARYAEDGQEKTLVELGEVYGVSRERIRQVQEEILRLLRRRAAGQLQADPEKFRSFDEWIAWAYLRLKQVREERNRAASRAAEKALRKREQECEGRDG